jgi:hypothetical protein
MYIFILCAQGLFKNDRIQRQDKIEITHMNTTKGTGTQKQQSTENKNVHEYDDTKTEALTV